MKPFPTEWMIDFYNHMTTPELKKIIESGWLSLVVGDAVHLGLNKLPSIDPFDDIAPMTDTAGLTISLASSAFWLLNEEESVGYCREESPDDDDDEEDDEHWESMDIQDCGAFDIFDDFDNENQI